MRREITADGLRSMYLDFFREKGHAVISGSSLIPENDPTVLFTTAGMHPLVPYLLGEPHPEGARLCNCQKCIRTGDIDEVGDASHLTFFEMLGNWSLGDYFKEEAIAWSWEFLTSASYLGFKAEDVYVTVFEGNEDAPRDETSAGIWKKLGVPETRILALPMDDNWWGPAGQTGPCGPDTEMFIDTGKPRCGPACRPGCNCGKFFEVWNDVFMQYNKTADGSFEPLAQHNVDTGMGVERTVAMLQGHESVFETALFRPLVGAIEALCGKTLSGNKAATRAFRVIADHVRSAAFILGDPRGVAPGNLGQGYVLRRLIRRSVRFAKQLGLEVGFTRPLAECVVDTYKHVYPELAERSGFVIEELVAEEQRFEKTLSRGLAELNKVLEKMLEHGRKALPGRVAFRLYDTCGFPLEFTEEICAEQGLSINRDEFDRAFDRHKAVSKQGADKAFKGGLSDSSAATTRLHTATHLLHRSLQRVLGEHVMQKGSNITAERLRFDFSHPEKMTPAQIREVEDLVNDQIGRDLPVDMKVLTLEEAREKGATALFDSRYGEQVKVYRIGDFSAEVCGGPHVRRTGELGHFRILKEGSSGAGIRRIRAVLE
jgi:alanyl-tRNA synthetase